MSAYGKFLTRHLKLQDDINVPIGLVLKELGQQLPQTHLYDPHQVLRQLKMADILFNHIAKKAHECDRQYPNFSNQVVVGNREIVET